MNTRNTAYAGTQYDYAVEYVAAHPRVKLITVQLGREDVIKLNEDCGEDNACLMAALPATLDSVRQNLTYTVASLRAAGYTGQIVFPTYYSVNYLWVGYTVVVSMLNDVIVQVAAATGAQVADVFGAFQAASEVANGDACWAGLLILKADECSCYDDPSPLGAQILAQAVTAVVTP